MVGLMELLGDFKASRYYEKKLKTVQERALLHPENLFAQVRLADLLAKLKKKQQAVGVYELAAQQFIQKNLFAHAIALKKIIFRLEPPKDAGEQMKTLQGLYEQMLVYRDTTSIAEEAASQAPHPSPSPSPSPHPSETKRGWLRLEPKADCPSGS